MMNKQLLKYNNLLLTRVVQINTIDDKVECLEAILHEGGGGGCLMHQSDGRTCDHVGPEDVPTRF